MIDEGKYGTGLPLGVLAIVMPLLAAILGVICGHVQEFGPGQVDRGRPQQTISPRGQ